MVAGHNFQEQGYNNSAWVLCQNQCSLNVYHYPLLSVGRTFSVILTH